LIDVSDLADQFSVDGVVISTSGRLTTARPCDSAAGIEPVGIESSSGVSSIACSAWRGASTAVVVSIQSQKLPQHQGREKSRQTA
jgi:hypothetical protein